MSPLAFFTQSKAKTLAWALFYFSLAVICLRTNLYLFTLVFVICGVLLSGSAAYKFVRDRGIIAQARIDRERYPESLLPPTMSSPGSTRLFVPRPIDRRH